MLRATLRHPVARFTLLGAVLFAGDRAWQAAGGARPGETIEVGAADLAQLRRQWAAQSDGEPLSAADERQLLARAVDEEILAREAARLDLDRGDRLVRDRLAKLAGFLGLAPGESAEVLESEARTLGLERGDPVIRRYLVHLMEIALEGPPQAPREDEIEARFRQVAARLEAPPRVRLSQIYLSRDVHGPALDVDARRLLAQLRARGEGAAAARRYGDPFAAGAQIGPATPVEITRLFGADFTAAVESAPSGRWWGPVPSSYGLHLVWIDSRSPARALRLDEVRNQIELQLVREAQDRRREERLRELRRRYRVEVDERAFASGASGRS